MLPDNYYSSLLQIKSLEKRLAKDPHLRNQYSKTIEDDLNKGYVIQVPPHNFSNCSICEWYLPHHPMANPNKPGEVRRVLNGASKIHGTSLNKPLLLGPDLLQNLVFVLLRFPQHHFAVSADSSTAIRRVSLGGGLFDGRGLWGPTKSRVQKDPSFSKTPKYTARNKKTPLLGHPTDKILWY